MLSADWRRKTSRNDSGSYELQFGTSRFDQAEAFSRGVGRLVRKLKSRLSLRRCFLWVASQCRWGLNCHIFLWDLLPELSFCNRAAVRTPAAFLIPCAFRQLRIIPKNSCWYKPKKSFRQCQEKVFQCEIFFVSVDVVIICFNIRIVLKTHPFRRCLSSEKSVMFCETPLIRRSDFSVSNNNQSYNS